MCKWHTVFEQADTFNLRNLVTALCASYATHLPYMSVWASGVSWIDQSVCQASIYLTSIVLIILWERARDKNSTLPVRLWEDINASPRQLVRRGPVPWQKDKKEFTCIQNKLRLSLWEGEEENSRQPSSDIKCQPDKKKNWVHQSLHGPRVTNGHWH